MKRTSLLVGVILVTMLTVMACSLTPLSTQIVNGVSSAIQSALPTATTVASNQAAQVAATSTPIAQQPQTSTQPTATAAPSGQTTQAQSAYTDTAGYQAALESVYQKVNPSVVSIQVIEGTSSTSGNSANPFGNNSGSGIALGSGFVWDKQGHIITNNHVVSGASSITVTFSDGTTVDASVVGTDPNADLAVLKVNAPANLLAPVTVGDSNQVKVGELVIAIGNPYGLSNTMTHGIISALSRTLPVGLDNQTQTTQTTPAYNIPDIIQTDAPINPGNSGGVLVDMNGNLIGVTAAIESSSNSNSGIGFVIPSEIVNKVVVPIIKTGKFNHPYLGITVTSVTSDVIQAMGLPADTKGALIVNVTPGGPAAKANLQGGNNQITVNGGTLTVGGDIITAVGNHVITSNDDLISYIFLHTNSGDTVTLTILRQGKEIKVPVTIGTFPTQ